ncbi:hypothetical protein FGO68_gene405 [Halteria grandinella]|uniref:Uncharacterized protein n=1 Tax=Halteria grandinella TaxID=5974 RepID=A0A8J8T0N8_HALGN|nr:hypothetical protein FGO68_gene405 [Halteria grandinella]
MEPKNRGFIPKLIRLMIYSYLDPRTDLIAKISVLSTKERKYLTEKSPFLGNIIHLDVELATHPISIDYIFQLATSLTLIISPTHLNLESWVSNTDNLNEF